MPGINELYASFVTETILHHERKDTMHQVTRAEIEETLLKQIDNSKLPTEYKLSWYHAILHTPLFDSLWSMTAVKHKLEPERTVAYKPDESLYSYDVPPNLLSPVSPRRRRRPAQRQEVERPVTAGRNADTETSRNTPTTPEAEDTSSDISSSSSSDESKETRILQARLEAAQANGTNYGRVSPYRPPAGRKPWSLFGSKDLSRFNNRTTAPTPPDNPAESEDADETFVPGGKRPATPAKRKPARRGARSARGRRGGRAGGRKRVASDEEAIDPSLSAGDAATEAASMDEQDAAMDGALAELEVDEGKEGAEEDEEDQLSGPSTATAAPTPTRRSTRVRKKSGRVVRFDLGDGPE